MYTYARVDAIVATVQPTSFLHWACPRTDLSTSQPFTDRIADLLVAECPGRTVTEGVHWVASCSLVHEQTEDDACSSLVGRGWMTLPRAASCVF